MAFRRNSDWSLNKGTDDIVYSFLDGTTKRYRKIDGRIYEVTEGKIACKTTAIIPTDEITAEQFDELKRWSDENYQAEDRYEVHHSRGQVPLELVENTLEASSSLEDESFHTLENALKILDDMGLTETQRRRFILHMQGLNTCEIAKLEGANQKTIWVSLREAEAKRKRALKKFFK